MAPKRSRKAAAASKAAAAPGEEPVNVGTFESAAGTVRVERLRNGAHRCVCAKTGRPIDATVDPDATEKAQMVDAACGDARGGQPARKVRRRNTDEDVQRIVRDRFSHMSLADLRSVTREGQTVEQHLLRLRREAKSRGGRITPAAIQDIVTKFCEVAPAVPGPAAEARVLALPSPGPVLAEVVQPALISALERAFTNNMHVRSVDGLSNFYDQCETLNSKEVAGLTRALLSLGHGSGSRAQTHINLFLHFADRLDLFRRYPEVLSPLKTKIEQCQVSWWTASKRRNESIRLFWATWDRAFHAFFDIEAYSAFVRLVEYEGTFTAQEPAVVDDLGICCKTELGSHMFHSASCLVMAVAWTKDIIQSCIQLGNVVCSPVELRGIFVGLEAKAAELQGMAASVWQRTIEVSYLSAPLQVQVRTPLDELHLRWYGRVKELSRGRGAGALPELDVLSWLLPVDPSMEFQSCTVTEWHGTISTVRGLMVSVVRSLQQPASGEEIMAALDARAVDWASRDRTLRVDIEALRWWHLIGCERKIEHDVLSIIDRRCTIEEAQSGCVSLKTCSYFDFAHPRCQRACDLAIQDLGLLARSLYKPPSSLDPKDSFLVELTAKIPNFLGWPKLKPTCFGKEAAGLELEHLASADNLELAMFKDLTRFKWLLDNTQLASYHLLWNKASQNNRTMAMVLADGGAPAASSAAGVGSSSSAGVDAATAIAVAGCFQ